MPANYHRIELKIPASWSVELEQMQNDVLERSGKKVSKSALILKMMENFFKEPSSSCNQNKKKT